MVVDIEEWDEIISSEEMKKLNNEDNVLDSLEYYIDWSLLNDDTREGVLECPDDAFDNLKKAIRREYGISTDEDIGIAINNFQEDFRDKKRKIHQLRARQANKIVCFDGMVRQATEVTPRIRVAFYEHFTGGCNFQISVVQNKDEETLPYICPACGNPVTRNNLKDLDDMFKHEDFQSLEVEEEPEGLKGRQPERLDTHMHGPFTREGVRAGIGDRVTILGIYRIRRNKNKTVEGKYIQVIGLERKGKNYEDLIITEEERTKFEEMSKNPTILEDISESFAPNIEGGEYEKKSIVLQQFDGNFYTTDRRRGNIHILLIGEPSTFKTKLANHVVDLSPHCIRATGGPTTAVGLTASAQKDESTGRWHLEAGAAVLADMGHLVVDEFDKMEDKVKGALHEIMEDGSCTVAKSGITATLPARCSILAIMNPKHNRFDPQLSTASQINLLPSMLSRFDLIFALKDKVNEARDSKIVDAMFRARCGTRPDTKYQPEDITKYIIYARSLVKQMTMDEDAMKYIKIRFLALRKANDGSDAEDVIPITFRQLDGMARLAEAHAKMRLSSNVELKDAKVAVEIFEYYMKTMCMDEQGYLCADATNGGITKAEKTKSKSFAGVLASLFEENGPAYVYSMDDLAIAANKEKQDIKKTVLLLSNQGKLCYNSDKEIKIYSSIKEVA